MRESRQFAGSSDRKSKFEENYRCTPREPPTHRPLHPLHGKHRQIPQRRRLHVVQHRLKPTPFINTNSGKEGGHEAWWRGEARHVQLSEPRTHRAPCKLRGALVECEDTEAAVQPEAGARAERARSAERLPPAPDRPQGDPRGSGIRPLQMTRGGGRGGGPGRPKTRWDSGPGARGSATARLVCPTLSVTAACA